MQEQKQTSGAPHPISIHLGLGSNLGDRLAQLQNAVAAIGQLPNTRVRTTSGVYETEPVGFKEQPAFFNAAIAVETLFTVEQFSHELKIIEQRLGRVPRLKWHEREIDIDILLAGNRIILYRHLSVPHPELPKRRFVLEPLAEIASGIVHPRLGKTIGDLLRYCPDTARVERVFPAAQLLVSSP